MRDVQQMVIVFISIVRLSDRSRLWANQRSTIDLLSRHRQSIAQAISFAAYTVRHCKSILHFQALPRLQYIYLHSHVREVPRSLSFTFSLFLCSARVKPFCLVFVQSFFALSLPLSRAHTSLSSFVLERARRANVLLTKLQKKKIERF